MLYLRATYVLGVTRKAIVQDAHGRQFAEGDDRCLPAARLDVGIPWTVA
jgi:hypothetical protein